jgi:hypothetical protein
MTAQAWADDFKAQAKSFEAWIDILAKDGEKVRDEAQRTFDSYSEKLIKQFKATRTEATKRVDSALQTVLDYSPIATTGDLKKLDR